MSAAAGAPVFFLNMGDTSQLPWSAIARHTTAAALYFFTFVQWPGYVVSEWAGEDRTFAYNLTSLMFTLAFWCACLYHYLVSAGRVEIEWSTGRVRAKGWIVRTSRRAHRVLLSLALAISAITIIQSTTTAMVITHFYIREDDPHPKEHAILVLLKINQTLAFFMFVYVLGRLVFEPVSIRKRRRAETTATENRQEEAEAAVPKHFEVPEESEECAICTEKWANRQLGCGHSICCCCLFEIWKTEHYTVARCPFCRTDIELVKKLLLIDGGVVPIGDCCERKDEPISLNTPRTRSDSSENVEEAV